VKWGPPGQVRIAVDWASRHMKDPSERTDDIPVLDTTYVQDFIREHLKNKVSPIPQFQSKCLMANVLDNNYVLDFAPKSVLGSSHTNVVIFTAGWAFKMIPLLGKALSDLAINGETRFDISKFNIDRHGILKNLPPPVKHMSQSLK
jgi:sarcosine oxidase/L-pipecolate oxidase